MPSSWVLIVVMANRVVLTPPVAVEVFDSEAKCWAYVRRHNDTSRGLWSGFCMTIEEAKERFAEVRSL